MTAELAALVALLVQLLHVLTLLVREGYQLIPFGRL